MKHYIVKVALYGITPEIWRRFSVPAGFTFDHFHSALQNAMGWEHKYDHEFRHGKGKYLRDVIAQPNPERFAKADSFQDESEVTLAGFMGRSPLPKRFLYLYDFADEWIHEITLEKSIESENASPQMIDGARALLTAARLPRMASSSAMHASSEKPSPPATSHAGRLTCCRSAHGDAAGTSV